MMRKIIDKIYEYLGKKLLTQLIKRNSRVPMKWFTDLIITIVCEDGAQFECKYIGYIVNKDEINKLVGSDDNHSLDDCKKLGLWKEKFGSLLRSR